MKSHRTSIRNTRAGFTLVEILVTTGIIAVLIGLGLFMSFDVYRHSLINDERDILVSMFLKARSQSLANLYQTPHGVCLLGSNYTIFRGSACVASSTNETIAKSTNITVTGFSTSTPIVFSQLSGDASPSSTITLSDGVSTRIISINNEGRIDW